MGFACPSIGSVFRPPAASANEGDRDPGNSCPNSPVAQRSPSLSRRSFAFLRDRGAASIVALRTWSSNGSSGAEAARRTSRSSSRGRGDSITPARRPRGGASRPAASDSTVASSAAPEARPSRGSGDGSLTPPTPPPATPPHPISIPATSPGTPQGVASTPGTSSRLGVASRPPPSYRPRASPGGLALPRSAPLHMGPADEEGYHDMVLPCGLLQDQVIDIMYRDLNPEDFEALCKLDERLPKRNTARWNVMDRLPRSTAGECGVTECGVCLAELDANAVVAKLPCKHAFHPQCISRWLTQCKNTCPLCQAPIQQSPIPGQQSSRAETQQPQRAGMLAQSSTTRASV